MDEYLKLEKGSELSKRSKQAEIVGEHNATITNSTFNIVDKATKAKLAILS